MGRQDVDYKKVSSAATKLKKRGIQPSMTDICDELGLLTISPELPSLLEQWYSDQPEYKRQLNNPLTENIQMTSSQLIKNAELEKSLSLIRATLESTADGIMIVNGKGMMVDWNQKFIEMCRIPSHFVEEGSEDLAFEYILEQLTDPEKIIADVEFLNDNPEWQGELPPVNFKDGRIFERYSQPQKIGNEIVGRVYSFRDITERKEMEKQLLQQATHDSLTGLPNRVLLMDRVEQAILQATKNKTNVAFLFLDLDRFKMINDTLGHSIGDKLLQAIANKLLIATNEFDTVARFGGDEFVVLLSNIEEYDEAKIMAEEILNVIGKSLKIDKHYFNITVSIGISLFPRDGEDYESLMKNADLSMYHAKDNGRNTYFLFESEMKQRVINHVQIDTALRSALKNKEFYLLYQPLIDLNKKCVIGHEALLRWCNPVIGHVKPKDFISIAEENGVIIEIGAWVIEEACKQAVRWHKKGYKDFTMAVNISGRQLHQSKLLEHVRDALEKTGLKAKYLELELTEGLLVENIDNAVSLMHQLKQLGVKLAIDDFGTGYSSLSYLKQFPLDIIKIDKSFIHEIVADKNGAAIVKAIINLGHSLNLKVLAEGVESEYQKNFITAHGCDSAQGYYYSPPGKPDIIEEFLQKFAK